MWRYNVGNFVSIYKGGIIYIFHNKPGRREVLKSICSVFDLQALNQYDSAARDLFQLQKIEPKNAAAKKELEVVLDLCRKVNVNNNQRIGLYQDPIKTDLCKW